jgi:hypothetical protein
VFTSKQHRAKATEYTELAKKENISHEEERSLTMLAENEYWLAENHDKIDNPATLAGEQKDVSNYSKQTSETNRPEGFRIIDYNEREEIITIELHRHLLENPGQREATINKFAELIEQGPKRPPLIILSSLQLSISSTTYRVPLTKLKQNNLPKTCTATSAPREMSNSVSPREMSHALIARTRAPSELHDILPAWLQRRPRSTNSAK